MPDAIPSTLEDGVQGLERMRRGWMDEWMDGCLRVTCGVVKMDGGVV